jgi:hypothetical protein
MMSIHTTLYITDLEGSLLALEQACLNSRIETGKGLWLTYEGKRLSSVQEHKNWDALGLYLDEGHRLVFGGDATDHHVGDITVMRLLVEVKQANPERVILVAGNRDLNKIRLRQETNEPFMDAVFEAIEKNPDIEPRWLENPKPRSLITFLETEQDSEWLQEAIGHQKEKGPQSYWNELTAEQKKILYTRWVVGKTLNAPKTFQNRKVELAHRLKGNSNWEVLLSFLEEDPHYRKLYLINAVLAVAIDNITFVHGGITVETFLTTILSEIHRGNQNFAQFLSPELFSLDYRSWFNQQSNDRKKVCELFQAFLTSLSEQESIQLRDMIFEAMNNEFLEAVREEFIPLSPTKQFDDLESPLIARGLVNRQSLPSEVGLVGYNHINKDGDIVFSREWTTFLKKAHCWDNVAGHIPQGEHPRVICQDVRFVLMDTTFKQDRGVPNEDILRIEHCEQGGHTLTCYHQFEKHRYPRMNADGTFNDDIDLTHNLIYLSKKYIPKKYHDKPQIESLPWIIGPIIERNGMTGYLCTQKRGPSLGFKTYTIILEPKIILEAIKDK